MNKISKITRQNIADETTVHKICYYGNLNEPDFLSRLFDLELLQSKDYRCRNAYDDIYQHTVNWNDYSDNWIYSDPRINLLRCDDEMYLKFLENTVHPGVRSNFNEIVKLVEIYNRHLENDGFEIIQTDTNIGANVYVGCTKSINTSQLTAKKIEIKKYLNTKYVEGKIALMNDNINKNTDVAIGTAKELLETTCKSILKQKGVTTDAGWPLSRLVKETSNYLNFMPKNVADADKAKASILQILGGISSIVKGVSELRNSYGTGHGKEADFQGLETKYAKLLVGVVTDIVLLYLSTNGETAELV